MRRVAEFLILAVLVVAVGWWLIHLPGTVTATVGVTTLSAPTPVALVAGVVLFLLAYVLLRLLVALFRLPSRSRRMRDGRRRDKGEAAMTRTLVALASGDAAAARREAGRSRALLGDTPQTLLFAAYAGRQAGATEEADAAFQLLAGRNDTAFLGLRGLMQQAIAAGDLPRAAELARQAEAASPGAAWLRTERSNLAIRMGDWKQALALAPADAARAPLATAAAAAERVPSEAVKIARRAYDADPAFVPASLAYAAALRATGRETKAQDVLRAAWAKGPHPDLATAAMQTVDSAASQLRRARELVQAAPASPESALVLAAALHAGGQHRAALEQVAVASRGGLNEKRLWALASDIAIASGDEDAQINALQRRVGAEPDSAWRCGNCGAAHGTWQPVCEACGTPGRVAWGPAGMARSDAGRLGTATPMLSNPSATDGLLT